jgi:hypothetical protein
MRVTAAALRVEVAPEDFARLPASAHSFDDGAPL